MDNCLNSAGGTKGSGAKRESGPRAGGKTRQLLSSALVLAAAFALTAAVVPGYLAQQEEELIRQGPGVTAVKKLSDWFEGIRGTAGDTDVYLLDSQKPGATAVVLGGTHGNEPAGYMAAIVMVENAVPQSGKIFVVPHANNSAMNHRDYQEASPRFLEFKAASGQRVFRYGSRATDPTDQWPDPDIYVHAASGQQLSGAETRNLNRAYPGRPAGTFTEKVAFAITSMIKSEKADLVLDLHEASPEYPVINAIVAHERAMPVASLAVLNLEFEDVKIALEPSPQNLHGLSHRELGDNTGALVMLFESSNASQGRLRGATDARLVVEGTDDKYLRAAKLGRLAVPFDEKGWPLKLRVGRHTSSIMAVFEAFSSKNPEKRIAVTGLPRFADLAERGLEPYL
jgi:hypothetical protein